MAYPDFSDRTVAVIGDIILDRYIWGDVTRISPEAPVPVVRIKRKTTNLGGAGNVAMNLKGLSCNPILIGTVGDDENGVALVEILNQEKIDQRIITIPQHPTTTKTRIIGQSQQVVRLDEEKLSYMTDAHHTELMSQIEPVLAKADAVILSDYGKGLITTGLCAGIIGQCRAKKIPAFVDPKGASWERYRFATCITPNSAELHLAAPYDEKNTADLEQQAIKLIHDLKLEYLLVTKGAEGMALFKKGAPAVHIPAKAKEVYDVSGAGDTVIAAIAAAFAAGMPMEKAAEFANKAAGIVVGKIGTQPIESFELKQIAWGDSFLDGEKIVNQKLALSKINAWRDDGKQIVFTNGCFDILHVGHIQLLNAAAKEGDKLIVGLNSDVSVKRLKGKHRPVVSEAERAALLAGIKGVDLVVLFDDETPIDLIRQFEPDVIVKGGDYTVETVVGHDIVTKRGGRVVIVPLVEGVSTSKVIESARQ